MKGIFRILVFGLLCLTGIIFVSQRAFAADPSADALLSKLSKTISSLGNYRVTFSADAEGNRMQGSYLVSGYKFRITTPEFEIIGDDKSRYEINHELEEVAIDIMDTTDINILVNPSRAFEFAAGNFSASYGGETTLNGVKCDIVKLTPLSKDSSLTLISLYLKRSDGLPLKLVYRVDGLDDEAQVTVEKFEGGVKLSPVDFRFDRSKYRTYEVIDFR